MIAAVSIVRVTIVNINDRSTMIPTMANSFSVIAIVAMREEQAEEEVIERRFVSRESAGVRKNGRYYR